MATGAVAMPATAGWPMAGGDHDHMAMMEEDERRTCWAHFAKIGLGLIALFGALSLPKRTSLVRPVGRHLRRDLAPVRAIR